MIPCNSMELEVRQYRWHEQFHGIPWSLECVNFMEFIELEVRQFHGIHRTWSAPISITRAVPCNFLELKSAPISMTQAVQWNSIKFSGTWSASISLTRAVPWKSMEFHGTWTAPISSSPMKFYGTSLVIKYIKFEAAWILVELKHV